MKNLINKSVWKKLSYIGLIIIVIAFFAIPSFIFAEGEGTATTETAQTAVTLDTTVGTSADTGETTIVSTTTEQPATTEVTTTTDQTVTTDTTVTTETVTTETSTTEQAATESTNVVNTEVVYSPLISTDKADYNPGETVTIFGSGFVTGEAVEVSFINADGATEHLGTVVAGESGSFIYSYAIIGSIEYTVTARSIINNISVTTNFLDSAYAQFVAAGPSLPGSQFYEERMDMNVFLNDGSGTSVPMYAFCIDLQHYLDTTGSWDVINFKDYNDLLQGPAGAQNTTLVTWQLPANVYALARSLDPAWLDSDSGGFTKAQKAAAVQEALWTLVSAANSTDGNSFNYQNIGNGGIPAIKDLVTTLIANANTPQAQVSSLAITPISDINYLQDDINLNKHDLNITATDYLGNVITGVPVNVTVTGNGFFDALGKTKKSITAISGTTISLYADKSDFAGVNMGIDSIFGFVDVSGDSTLKSSSLPSNVSTDLIGSILWPNNRPYPISTNLPWGSNQLLILTGLYEPQAQATKEWRIPGEITVYKSDGVDSTSLAGAIIILLDGSGNPANDAWGKPLAEQKTDSNGDILGFKGLAWGNYQVKENTAPAGYNLAANIPVTINSTNNEIIGPLSAEVKMADTRIPGQLKLTKTDSVTGKPVPGATYNIYDSSGNLVETITTGPDGSVALTLQKWGTYTVKEGVAPAGYLLDPATYTVTFDANNTSQVLNVKDDPTGGGGGGTTTLTVAGLTEGTIQVLAFTGLNPIIPIAGMGTVLIGFGLFVVSLKKRVEWKHVAKR